MSLMNKLLTACVMSLAIGGEFAANAATLPQLPQKQVDVTMPTVTGSTLNATCATFQAQLNAAAALNVNLTHQIILATGTTCTGSFSLPSHTGGTGWILIKGPNYASLPASGTRVSLSDATHMPKIKYGETDPVNGAIAALTGAQRYRIIGIEFLQNDSLNPNYAFIVTGYNNWNATNTGYIILDRVVMHDTNTAHDTRRAVAADAELGNTALVDSYIEGITSPQSDTQAWLSISNAGPILIQNSFLQASGENFMACGGEPKNSTVMPKDITIKRNTFSKNPAWISGGAGLVVKTLLELKCGNRVLIEGNTFQTMSWDNGGHAHRLTVRNENHGATFAEVSDLTIRYNLYHNITNWINEMGSDDGNSGTSGPSMHSKRWYIHDNLVYGLGWICGGGADCGSVYSIQQGGVGTACTDPTPTCKNENLTIAHNTIDGTNKQVLYVDTAGQIGLDFRDNLINSNGSYGIFGIGAATIYNAVTLLNTAWAGPTWSFTHNSVSGIGGNGLPSSTWPQGNGNSYPASSTSFLWTNAASGDYNLQAGSPAKHAASDGTDQGVNFTAYNAARAGGSGGGGDVTPPATPQGVTIR